MFDAKDRQRVLWLFNHETLTSFEVPLLRKLGFEVFTPKIYPETEEYGSATATWEHDSSLTIPPAVLALLNKCNFYKQPPTNEMWTIINRHFSSCFFNTNSLLEPVLKCFSGIIFYRVFGREAPLGYDVFFTRSMKKSLQQDKRFFFAQALPYLSEIESEPLKAKAITLPFGIPEHVSEKCNTWTGGNGKLLFVCPRITSSPYYKGIYGTFRKHFSDVPHLIAGKQFHQLPDPAVQGNLPRDKYDAVLRASEVLFYHSEEPRHIHYHPLEAMIFGMPVVYMQKGVLGRSANLKLPGACHTFAEAKEKVNKILGGDMSFSNEVIEAQKQLLADMCSPDRCEQTWRSAISAAYEMNRTPVNYDDAQNLVEQYKYPCWLDRNVAQRFEPQVVLSPERVFVHPSARVDSFVKIEGGEGVYVGPDVHVASFCHLNIGGGVLIIEEGARCSSGSKFVSGSHVQKRAAQSQNIKRSFVHIGRNALVFTNAVILPGCSVGENAVVGAGSIVTRDVPAREVWAGNPAKKIGTI